MMKKRNSLKTIIYFLAILLIVSCSSTSEEIQSSPTAESSPEPQPSNTPWVSPYGEEVSYSPDSEYDGISLFVDDGSDVETISMPDTERSAIRSGNGAVLPANNGNNAEDWYVQFQVDDEFLYDGNPTSRVVIIIEYLDDGEDTFNIQYDALTGGPYGTGKYKDSAVVYKTGTGEIKTAELYLCDANFSNRDNGTDFRLGDSGDGAETILSVTVRILAETSGPLEINVDSCGANPYDDQPDSDAIQSCLAMACSGDTIVFTSGIDEPDYQGYLIDKTLFLVYPIEKSDLTFTSTDADDHALLQATADLKGFVVHLRSRALTHSPGLIDNITLTHLDIDGNKAERVCTGGVLPGQRNAIGEGENDNWGNWLWDCPVKRPGDSWCNPGIIYLSGGIDFSDPAQDYEHNPELWSTGFQVQDVNLSNGECGTAFFFEGADYRIDSVTIDTAGEHTHYPGCQPTEDDDPVGSWSDGITFIGPAHQLTNNLIMDPSDVGIVSFGGRDIVIADNTILAREGNHGMFAGIAMHPGQLGLIDNLQVTGNQVINQADQTCGGIHFGINLGVHTWANGCSESPVPASYGVTGDCSIFSPPPEGAFCEPNTECRTWGYISSGSTLTLADNTVTGAQVNFMISGLDVLGELILTDNHSVDPQLVDWEDDVNCVWTEGYSESWGALDFAAFNPTVEGWVEQQIYCAR
jgi:hypothetical protein